MVQGMGAAGGGRALPGAHLEARRELWLQDIVGFALLSQRCPIFLLNFFHLPHENAKPAGPGCELRKDRKEMGLEMTASANGNGGQG